MDIKTAVKRALIVILMFFIIPMTVFFCAGHIKKISVLAGRSAKTIMVSDHDCFSGRRIDSFDFPLGTEVSSNNYWDIGVALEETENENPSFEIPSPLPAEDVSDMIPYPDHLEDNDGMIQKYTYTHYDDPRFFDLVNGGMVRNCTDIPNAELLEASCAGMPFELDKDSEEPQILIYHTHATESFELTDREFYDSDFCCKTTERDKNIISVGDKICEELDKAGIPYIHDTLVHDYPSYDAAYASSRAAVEEILEQYPSIKICLDIHRDGIEREDGTRIAPVTEINGREAAQIMIISCADDGSGDIPNYTENFQFACEFQSELESMWPGLTRPILFDTRFYNQDLSTGCLLIEVGSHGNSLDQVWYSGELIGKTLALLFE